MIKKTMTYTNYNNEEVTEDFYFNLTKAECLEMEMVAQGGLAEQLDGIVKSKDKKKIVETFKEVVLKAYGVKSPDGRRFIKTQELAAEFAQTEAYSDLFMELATKADAAIEFVNGIIPKVVPEDHSPTKKSGLTKAYQTIPASE